MHLSQKEGRLKNGLNFYKKNLINLSMVNKNINHFMTEDMNMAKLAFNNDEVPVGKIDGNNGKIIGRGGHQVIAKNQVS